MCSRYRCISETGLLVTIVLDRQCVAQRIYSHFRVQVETWEVTQEAGSSASLAGRAHATQRIVEAEGTRDRARLRFHEGKSVRCCQKQMACACSAYECRRDVLLTVSVPGPR